MAEGYITRKGGGGVELKEVKLENYVAGENLVKGDIGCTYSDFTRITLEDNNSYEMLAVIALSNTRFAAVLRLSSTFYIRTYEVDANTKIVTSRSSYFNTNISFSHSYVSIHKINSTTFWVSILANSPTQHIGVYSTNGSTVSQLQFYNPNATNMATPTLFLMDTFHSGSVLVRIYRNSTLDNIGYAYWQSYRWTGSSISLNGGTTRLGSSYTGVQFVKTDDSGGIATGKTDGGSYPQVYIGYSVNSSGTVSAGSNISLTNYNNSAGCVPVLETYLNGSSNGYAFIIFNLNQNAQVQIKRVQRNGTSVSDLGNVNFNDVSLLPLSTWGLTNVFNIGPGTFAINPSAIQNENVGWQFISYSKTEPYAINTNTLYNSNRSMNNFRYNRIITYLRGQYTNMYLSTNSRGELFYGMWYTGIPHQGKGPAILNSRTIFKHTGNFEKVVGVVDAPASTGQAVAINVPNNF